MKAYSYCKNNTIRVYWNVTEISVEKVNAFQEKHTISYKYIRKESAKLPVDEEYSVINVGGRQRSFVGYTYNYYNVDVFRFGKYCGKKIAEVKDLPYTCWYWKTIENGDHKEFIKAYLYENWYEARTNREGEEYMFNIKKANEKQERIERNANAIRNRLRQNNIINLEINRWPNKEGKIKIDGVEYIFPKVKEYWYGGYSYYMPVLNGSAKRIKNRTIKATIMTFDNNLYITNFKVIKK